MYKHKMVITIWGTCRQYTLSTLAKCTNLQEQVTYPYSTKEALQAILWCKGDKNSISEEDTRYCFRRGLLDRKTVQRTTDIMKQFRETDVFVIEIASRKNYCWKNAFVHSIAKDPIYTSELSKEITIQEQTKSEIENDLLRIQKELEPKKILIVTHFATYQHGPRWELIQWLEEICHKHQIPIVNPCCLLEAHEPHKLFVNEPKLTHYTELGKEEITRLYEHALAKI